MEPLRKQYTENTRHALLDAGRNLFSTRAYADVSAEELVRAAGLTRGALYHHFDGKRGLFEAIFSEFEDEAAQNVKAAIAAFTDPFERADAGAAAYLNHCAEDHFRHVVLQEGLIALGWHRCVEIDLHYLGGVLFETVQAVLEVGAIKPHPAELLASAFYGALTDLALTIAISEDPLSARKQAIELAHDLLSGLRTSAAT